MRSLFLALAAVLALAGCEFYTPASPDEIARARYVSPEPPSITLMSMVNARSGKSAHSGILINGSEQVLFDPAGTFTHPDLPRKGDVHYGMTPRFADAPADVYPEALRAYFEGLPGVEDHYVTESDVGKNNAWDRSEAPRG